MDNSNIILNLKKSLIIKTCLIILFFCTATSLFAETFKKNILNEKFSVGFYPTVFYFNSVINAEKDNYAKISSLEISPFIAYNIYQNLFLGTKGTFEYYKSNFYYKEPYKELGLFAQYILPFKIDKGICKILKFYIEAGYYKTNFIYYDHTVKVFEFDNITIEEDFLAHNKLLHDKIIMPIGMQVKVYENLHIDFNWQFHKYIKGAYSNKIMIGVLYYFK
ncbi:MAG: hypothetical protein JXB49_18330 [Bacteroidales bacterium]|nr:hypothetical protein [Bacteroidales bacterium]